METTYRVINALDEHHIPQLMDLYRAEWWTRTRTVEQVCDTLKWSDLVMGLCSQPGERLVAFARVLTDTRERQREFDERGPLSASELLARITSAVNEADRVLATVAPSTLLEHRRIQNYDVTVLQAIYAVVEHFSMHTGQIIVLAKIWKGDLGFYELSKGVPHPTWGRGKEGD